MCGKNALIFSLFCFFKNVFFKFVKSIKNFIKFFSEKVVKSQIYLFLITLHSIEVI